jgi:hypothetical protein
MVKSFPIDDVTQNVLVLQIVVLAYQKDIFRVVKISRNLTFENSQTRTERRRNSYISPPQSSRFSVAVDLGGPYGSATGPLSHDDDGPVAMQQGPCCEAVRPLRQNFRADFIAHFRRFRRNTLWLRR